MVNSYEIKDSSKNSRSGILHNGTIEVGGEDRNYKSIARLPNDTSEDPNNTNSYIEVGNTNPFETDVATISCWINPEGASPPSAGIVLNTDADGKLYGLLLRANESQLNLGYVWGTTEAEMDVDFGVEIPLNQWSHVLLLVYKSGLSRLFVNNIYVAEHDMGYIRKKVVFDNIKIGRFAGLLDNVTFYSDTLDYGNVPLNSPATHEVAYMYSLNRTEYEQTPIDRSPTRIEMVGDFIKQTDGIRVYYKQTDEYVEAHDNYINNTIKEMNETGSYLEDVLKRQSSEQLDEQKFTIVGGPNEQTRRFADGKFRSLPGEITEL